MLAPWVLFYVGTRAGPPISGTACSPCPSDSGVLGDLLTSKSQTFRPPGSFPLDPGPVTYSPPGPGTRDFTFVRFVLFVYTGRGHWPPPDGCGWHRLDFSDGSSNAHPIPHALLRGGFDILHGGVRAMSPSLDLRCTFEAALTNRLWQDWALVVSKARS